MNMRASRGYDSSLELFFPSSLDLRIVSGLLIALITRCNMDLKNNYLFVIVFVSSQQCCLPINLSYVQYRTTYCLHAEDFYWGKLDDRDLKCAFVLKAFENCKNTSREQRESMSLLKN